MQIDKSKLTDNSENFSNNIKNYDTKESELVSHR